MNSISPHTVVDEEAYKVPYPVTIVLFVAFVCMFCIGICGDAAFVKSTYISPYDAGIVLYVSISGNDLVVNVVGGKKIDELQSISLSIDGINSPAAARPVSESGGKIIYPNQASGLTGTRMVDIHGTFSDGESQRLVMLNVKFT